MIKLSLMTSNMSIMTNGWNVDVVLLIGPKNSCNYCLVLCFLHQMFFLKH
jgi:hypothetical protein